MSYLSELQLQRPIAERKSSFVSHYHAQNEIEQKSERENLMIIVTCCVAIAAGLILELEEL